jgi:hypothetical protein
VDIEIEAVLLGSVDVLLPVAEYRVGTICDADAFHLNNGLADGNGRVVGSSVAITAEYRGVCGGGFSTELEITAVR